MIVALLALLVALGGTAIAANVVPLANRARVADNAKKLRGKSPAEVAAMPGPATTLDGKTAEQIAALPGPATTIADLVVVKTAPLSIPGGEVVDLAVQCDAGQKAIGGGYDAPDTLLFLSDTRPTASDGGWKLRLANGFEDPATGTLYAICVK
jgi:hypothetical protein